MGRVVWFVDQPAPEIVGAFDGRVYLASGVVLDTSTGSVIYRVQGGLLNVWVTKQRLYLTRPCPAFEEEADQCLEVVALDPVDGEVLWKRQVADDRFSNLAVGQDLSVHLVTQELPPRRFSEAAAPISTYLAFDRDGQPYESGIELEGDLQTRLFQFGPVLVTHTESSYRGWHGFANRAQKVPPELIPPAGWIPGRGSRAGDFRPE